VDAAVSGIGGSRLSPRILAAVLTGALAGALAGCGGGQDPAPDAVAQAVAPKPLPSATRTASAASAPARAPAKKQTTILSAADRASFGQLDAVLGGEQGLAVSGLGRGRPVERVGSLRTGVAWSTSKVPIAMAVLDAGMGDAERGDLTAAITASDNAAATRLWTALGGGAAAAQAADAQLAQAGDRRTRIESRDLAGPSYTPFGQTTWALSDQARFSAGMSCTGAGPQVLGLMGQVIAGQRWGLGAAGVAAELKGGWGPGTAPGATGGYLDRQMGVITLHGKPLAVAIASRPGDGSHGTGTRDLTRIARWLVAHADTRSVPARARC
jgi:hypothetical protein